MALEPSHRSENPVSEDVLRVFVLCPSFHGATLLALLLSEHEDVSTWATPILSPFATSHVAVVARSIPACSGRGSVMNSVPRSSPAPAAGSRAGPRSPDRRASTPP